MTERKLDRLLVALLAFNVLLTVVGVLSVADAFRGTPDRPVQTASIQTPSMDTTAPGLPPSQSFPPSTLADPAFTKTVPLEDVYWGLFRYQESPVTALTEEQFGKLRAVLQAAPSEEAEDRKALLACLTQQQISTLSMWVARAKKLGPAAGQSVYAARADALALVSGPWSVAPGDTGPDGPDKPRLAVPYFELLWGVAEVHKSSGMPLTRKQRYFVADKVEKLLGIFARMQTVYTSAYLVAHDTLRPEQLAYVKKHWVPIEEYSLKFRDVVPMDADVVGYVATRMMARKAGMALKDIPPPAILDVKVNPSPSSDTKPDPEYYFAGALMLAEDPSLALDAEQCRKLVPYVKGVADANYQSHMTKETIGNELTKKQRIWIMARIQKTAGQQRTYPSPGEVIQLMRKAATALLEGPSVPVL